MISKKGEELFQNWVCQSVLQYNAEALSRLIYLCSTVYSTVQVTC